MLHSTPLFSARLHWWIYSTALLWFSGFVFSTCVGLIFPHWIQTLVHRLHIPDSSYFYLLFGIASMAFLSAAHGWLVVCMTRIDLTPSHVVLRSGWWSVQQMELPRAQIESTSVQQTLFGRILGFGDITFFGTGGRAPTVYGVANPHEFTKRI
jgi:Bacterial PH domain